MRALGAILLCGLVSSLFVSHKEDAIKEVIDEGMNEIRAKGYLLEAHDVITDDGYILTLHHLSNSSAVKVREEKIGNVLRIQSKPVIFLQHGLLASSYLAWMSPIAKTPWAFHFADQGYDVWMGNSRGSRFSQRHVQYNTDSDEFWNFTWDDMAEHDLPAFLKTTLTLTGARSIIYMGHSQGTTIAFAAMSENAWIRKHISLFIALAPVATLKNISSNLVLTLGSILSNSNHLFFGSRSFPPLSESVRQHGTDFCTEWKSVCTLVYGTKAMLSSTVDFTSSDFQKANRFNQTKLISTVLPRVEETSVKNMIHWAQETRASSFTRFDYENKEANIAHYGTETPPQYEIEKATVPTVVISGSLDGVAAPSDVQWLTSKLPTLKEVIALPTFSHTDFLWADDLETTIFPMVDRVLNSS